MTKNSNIRFQIVVVCIGVLLMVVKFAAYFTTHSNAILTDALESIVNIVAGAFALYSLIIAGQPRDENHPYGHGKIEFISASIEGSLIFMAGVLIIGKSIYNIFNPVPIYELDLGILLTSVCGLLNYGLGFFTEKKGIQHSSLTMIASGKHLKSDAYSTVGLIVGLGTIYLFKINWLDNVIAIVFGLLILRTSIGVLRKSIAGIMDEADYELLESIIRIVNENRREAWIDMHNMRIIKFGNVIHIDCHITIPWYYNTLQAHDEVKDLEELIRSKFNRPVELFIHTDPCLTSCCKLCQISDCKVRQFPFEHKVDWNLQNVMANKKHSL